METIKTNGLGIGRGAAVQCRNHFLQRAATNLCAMVVSLKTTTN